MSLTTFRESDWAVRALPTRDVTNKQLPLLNTPEMELMRVRAKLSKGEYSNHLASQSLDQVMLESKGAAAVSRRISPEKTGETPRKESTNKELAGAKVDNDTALVPRRVAAGQSKSGSPTERRLLKLIWRKQPVPRPLSPEPEIEVFVEAFLYAFAPPQPYGILCDQSDALHTVARERHRSTMLQDAFDAAATIFYGHSTENETLIHRGFAKYNYVVPVVNKTLSDETKNKSDFLLAAVICLLACESIMYKNQTALMTHRNGVLDLLRIRGPELHKHGFAHQCFVEFRPDWVATALISRKPSFLSTYEWRNVPWTDSTVWKERDMMQSLLDVAAFVPEAVWLYDSLQTFPDKLSPEYQRQLNLTCQRVREFERELLNWKGAVAEEYPYGQPANAMAPLGKDLYPIFRCRDPVSNALRRPPVLVFPDPQLARTMAYYWAVRIILWSVDPRPLVERFRKEKRLRERHDFACRICRSLEYYLRTAPGLHINRMAFPVRVAFDALPADGPERRYLWAMCKLIKEKTGLNCWSTMMPELSMATNRATVTSVWGKYRSPHLAMIDPIGAGAYDIYAL